MIRLTLLLLAGIAVTLSVAGRDLPETAATDTAAVTRKQTDPPTAPSGRLALDDEAGAIERALNAAKTIQPATVQPAAVQTTPTEGVRSESGAVRATVNAERVNLRTGPSTSNSVIDQVVRDQTVEILGAQDDWARIRVTQTGLEAWIFGRFLTPQG